MPDAASSARQYMHGLVLGKFYPLHAGHSHLIRTAQRACERVTVQVLASSGESIAMDVRSAWIREDHPTVRVVAGLDDAAIDYASPVAWDAHMAVIEALLDAPVDAVFTSDAYGEELARRLGATWVQVDEGRAERPISGTAIRGDLVGHWGDLSSAVRRDLAARVVVLGAESTGSTTLSFALAARLGAEWVPEYGREYCVDRPGGMDAQWVPAEFELIVEAQLVLEREALRTTQVPLVICDTDALTTALFYERYMGETSARIMARVAAHLPDLYIVTGDEIPWVQDDTRDGEDIRSAMQKRFRETLAELDVPWIEVHGSVEERLAASLAAIEEHVVPAQRLAPPLG